MLSPAVENPANVWHAKAEQYCTGGFVNYVPSMLSGVPATSIIMTIGRAASWTAADADAEIEVVITIPATIDTPDALRTQLRTKTVGDLTVGQRNSMQAVFDAHSIPRADFVLSTPLSRVFRRLCSWLFEQDENFGLGFNL